MGFLRASLCWLLLAPRFIAALQTQDSHPRVPAFMWSLLLLRCSVVLATSQSKNLIRRELRSGPEARHGDDTASGMPQQPALLPEAGAAPHKHSDHRGTLTSGGPYPVVPDSSCSGHTAVWVLVLDANYVPTRNDQLWLERLQKASPICVQIFQTAPDMGQLTFVQQKQLTVRDAILNNPSWKYILCTDAYDVYVNPFSEKELLSRFKAITKGRAPLVVAAEPSCMSGQTCEEGEPKRWLDRVRQGGGKVQILSFPNSQFIGERDALMSFFTTVLGARKGKTGLAKVKSNFSNGEAVTRMVRVEPDAVTLDIDERIFASMARGMARVSQVSRLGQSVHWSARGPIEGRLSSQENRLGLRFLLEKFTCTKKGVKAEDCQMQKDWGDCRRSADGTVAVHELYKNRTVTPLTWHLNGPAKHTIKSSKHCRASFGLPMEFRGVKFKQLSSIED